ncbi:hypothetical protein [Nostoc sp.]|uniref:hypothetical protein n=1 Tax=Nostoc sp. TaxID=1180 RepID=UPI002FF929E4
MTPEINTQDWQQAFIATNILAIGYNAWVGYLGRERGVVICSTNFPHLGMAGEIFEKIFCDRVSAIGLFNVSSQQGDETPKIAFSRPAEFI